MINGKMSDTRRAFYSTHPECVRAVNAGRWTVGLSWTYEIFIDPASLWVGCLVGCPLLIQISGNKHSTGQTSKHTLGMWAQEILHAGRASSTGGRRSIWVQYI